LVDAILVGSGTVRADDPQLTVRKVEQTIVEEEQPLRVILDGATALDSEAKIFQPLLPGKTVLASQLVGDKNYKLEDLLLALGKQGIRSLLVEGGAQVLTLFFENEAVDEIQCYIAPKLVGGTKALTPFMGDGIEQMLDAQCFSLARCDKQGDDVLLTYYKGVS
jgi:diaminohydroxyphosphoribosylaminopyrimidine deaminase/5-amino-6-(5-phosphoribosylamino)uracil reductase